MATGAPLQVVLQLRPCNRWPAWPSPCCLASGAAAAARCLPPTCSAALLPAMHHAACCTPRAVCGGQSRSGMYVCWMDPAVGELWIHAGARHCSPPSVVYICCCDCAGATSSIHKACRGLFSPVWISNGYRWDEGLPGMLLHAAGHECMRQSATTSNAWPAAMCGGHAAGAAGVCHDATALYTT